MMIFSWESVITVIAAIVIIGGIFGRGWLKIQNDTMTLIKGQNEELRNSNELFKATHVELNKQINSLEKKLCELEGMVHTLKSIPLVNIDVTLKEIAKFNHGLLLTNGKILHQLQIDAKTLEHESATAAEAVLHVKQDLEHKGE